MHYSSLGKVALQLKAAGSLRGQLIVSLEGLGCPRAKASTLQGSGALEIGNSLLFKAECMLDGLGIPSQQVCTDSFKLEGEGTPADPHPARCSEGTPVEVTEQFCIAVCTAP